MSYHRQCSPISNVQERPRATAGAPKPMSTAVFLALVCLISACGLTFDGPDVDRPAIPSRAVAPWRVESLEVCLGAACSIEIAGSVRGADVRWDGQTFRMIATIDGNLHRGELTRGWKARFDPHPVLEPTQLWQTSGYADPDWLADGIGIVYGVADGSAIGIASLAGDAIDSRVPLWTATDLGRGRIAAPSVVATSSRIGLAIDADGDEILLAWGSDFESLGEPTTALRTADVTYERWRDVQRLSDPHLDIVDGIVRLFFAARGKESEDGRSAAAAVNASIGFAASVDGDPFTVFAHNPVHDRISDLLFHADELEPSIAIGEHVAVMLYHETGVSGTGLAIAVHELP